MYVDNIIWVFFGKEMIQGGLSQESKKAMLHAEQGPWCYPTRRLGFKVSQQVLGICIVGIRIVYIVRFSVLGNCNMVWVNIPYIYIYI